jgi:predicted amidohydrolase YtcJ
MRADLVLSDGRVFDGNSIHPTASAVAVADGVVVPSARSTPSSRPCAPPASICTPSGTAWCGRGSTRLHAPLSPLLSGHPRSADRQPADSWQRRHSMAYVQLVHPQDVPRFGEFGVAVSAQALTVGADLTVVGGRVVFER